MMCLGWTGLFRGGVSMDGHLSVACEALPRSASMLARHSQGRATTASLCVVINLVHLCVYSFEKKHTCPESAGAFGKVGEALRACRHGAVATPLALGRGDVDGQSRLVAIGHTTGIPVVAPAAMLCLAAGHALRWRTVLGLPTAAMSTTGASCPRSCQFTP